MKSSQNCILHSLLYVLFQTFKNNGQSEIKRKANSSLAEVNGHCEDEIAAQGGY